MTWQGSAVQDAVFAYAELQTLSKALDLAASGDTLKTSLFLNATTPDRTVTTAALSTYNGTASQWVTTNEVATSGSYTNGAGGLTLTGQSLVQLSNVVYLCSTQAPQWTGVTWNTSSTEPYGCLINDSTATQGICFLYFGPQSITSGTLTIVFQSVAGVTPTVLAGWTC